MNPLALVFKDILVLLGVPFRLFLKKSPQKRQKLTISHANLTKLTQKEVKIMEEDKCQQCGTPASPGAKYCEACGAKLIAERASQAPPPGAPQPEPASVPPYAPAPTFQPSYAPVSPYQGVAIRFVAILIDTIIIAIISGVLTFPLQTPIVTVTNVTGTPTIATTPNPLGWLSGGVSLLIFLLYFILLEGAYGQTVGKMAVKIKVLKEDGTKIDYADAAVRNILRIIDAIPYFVPYLLGAILIWTSDMKQRVGDRAARTVVVKA
jgi:uncharacterized RDD family membrane protein YckC